VPPGAAAFAGAALTFVAVFLLAGRGGVFSPNRLILSGVILGYALLGLTQFLIVQADDPGKTHDALYWLFGSLAGANWARLGVPAAVLVAGVAALLVRGRALNALLVGDETAASLGVRPERVRRELFAVVSLVTGIMVSVSGGISFVGLIVPHTVRLVVGSEHRRLLPVAALGGALFLVVVDLVCRMLLRPQEIPVGVVTSVLGAPIFLVMMSRRRVSETGL
jgi:iron complex transport system permease protein